MLAHTSGLRVQDHVDAAAMLATGSARMRLCSLIRALRATQCPISRLKDAMFAVVEHVILLRLTSPGNGWKQKGLSALQIRPASGARPYSPLLNMLGHSSRTRMRPARY